MLEEQDRVRVLDGGSEEPVCVLDGARADHLEPRRADEPAFGRARMKRAAAHPAAGRAANHDRDRLPGAPVRLRGHGHDRVERTGDEVCKLQLDDRPLAHPRGADRCADEALLRDRGVHHPALAELLDQARCDAEGTTEDADILPEQEHALVVAHCVLKCRADRFEVRDRPRRTLARAAAGRLQMGGRRHRTEAIRSERRGSRRTRHGEGGSENSSRPRPIFPVSPVVRCSTASSGPGTESPTSRDTTRPCSTRAG